ncbi:hypothetical protein Pmani_029742 [Petrolisthes manimaculis]|uniref:C2H2-type domain-containing protein n=1 Tax=Petrolisthes manimaculis TaxID=1843537 RepID=A0AAE1NYR5_9EUCA|nr:hypothetical protein Pmani_029742 [Petrolisthes manimaculis]
MVVFLHLQRAAYGAVLSEFVRVGGLGGSMEPRRVSTVAPAPPVAPAPVADRQPPYMPSPEWRPYSCRFCLKKFKRKDHLTDHERLHTGERPYHCQHCGRGFAQRSNCRNHAVRCPAAASML